MNSTYSSNIINVPAIFAFPADTQNNVDLLSAAIKG